MANIKLGKKIFNDVEEIKLNTVEGEEVVFGLGGGEADHSMEDALIEGTLEHYVNDRVTRIKEHQGLSFFHTALWWSFDCLKSVSMEKLESMPRDSFGGFFSVLESVDFPSLKNVPDYAFESCESLKNVNLPMATSVGRRAFADCYSLTQIVLPNATVIGEKAFYFENYDPVFIDLPKANSFGSNPFPVLTNAHIILRNETVANGEGSADEEYMFDGYIYVPSWLVDSYKATPYWSGVANRIRTLEDYTVDGTITGELDMSKI